MSLELPDSRGYFGDFGGCFAPEILIQTLGELQDCYAALRLDSDFLQELQKNQQKIAGRATPLDFAAALTEHAGGAKIYLKREDLTQTGSHHINSTIGQAMLARRLEKTRLIAETSTGRHGVATATVASLFDMTCTVYMGLADMARETGAVRKMQELGASVNAVETGTQKLIDANAEVTRDWVGHTNASFLCR